MGKIKALFVILTVLLMTSACGKGNANADDSNNGKYAIKTITYLLDEDANSFVMKTDCSDDSLIYITQGEKYKVVKSFPENVIENEVLFETTDYLLTFALEDDNLWVCQYLPDEDRFSVFDLYENETKNAEILIDRAEMGTTYPIDMLAVSQGFVFLMTDSIVYVDNEGKNAKRFMCPYKNFLDITLVDKSLLATLCQDENGRNVVAYVDIESMHETKTDILDKNVSFCCCISDKLMFSDGKILYLSKGQALEKEFDFSAAGISADRFRNMYADEEDIHIISADVNPKDNKAKVYHLVEADAENYLRNEKTEILVYTSQQWLLSSVISETMIEDYNDLSPLYHVSVLNTEDSIDSVYIIENNPDILVEFSSANIERYQKAGYLENLMPYINASKNINKDSLGAIDNSCLINKGGVYAIPEYLAITGVVMPKSSVDFDSWNVDTFLEWIENNPGVRTSVSLDKSVLLDICMKANIAYFANDEYGNPRFNSDEFKHIIKRIDEIPIMESSKLSWSCLYDEGTPLDSAFFDISYYQNLRSYALLSEYFDEPLQNLGYPSVNGDGRAILAPFSNIAIFANSSCKEGAYDFLEYCILYPEREMQFDNSTKDGMFWTTEDLRHKSFEMAMGYHEEGELKYDIDQSAIDFSNGLIEDAISISEVEENVEYIVLEEYDEYLQGIGSIDSMCDKIQSRVSVYMDEVGR